MSQPIKIIVTAETAQAAAQLQAFVAQSGSALTSFAGNVAATGKVAEEAGLHIAGMSYYARGAIDSIRYAAAGGGARAGFYALDETIRGLLQSGIRLGTLVPVIGGVVAAVGAGYYVWEQWNAGEREAAERAKDLAEAFKALPPLLKEIAEMQQSGLLSPAAAAEYQEAITRGTRGGKKLYIGRTGELTTESTSQVFHPQEAIGGGQFGGGQVIPAGFETVQNKVPTQAQIQKLTMDQATAGGTLTEVQIQAQSKLKEELHAASEERLTGIDKEIAKVHDQYQKQRDEITQTALLAGAKLGDINFAGSPQVRAVNAAFAQSKSDEAAAVTDLQQKARDEAVKKQAESQNKIREQYAKEWQAANKQLDTELTLEAAQSGSKREEVYAQEYLQRAALAFKFYVTGKLSEADYATFIKEQEAKLYEGRNAATEKDQRAELLRMENARADVEARIASIETDSTRTRLEKDQQEIGLKQQLLALEVQQIEMLQRRAALTPDEAAQEGYQREIERLKKEIAVLQNQLQKQGAAGSVTGAFGEDSTRMRDKVSNPAADLAGFAISPIEGLQSGLNRTFDQLLERGMTVKQFFGSLSIDILKSMISSFSQMAANFVTNTAMMLLEGAAFEFGLTQSTTAGATARTAIRTTETAFHNILVGLRVAAHIAGEVASTIATGAYAALRAAYHLAVAVIAAMESEASIPYIGVVLAIAAGAAIAAAAAGMMGAFAEGGRPVPGQLALVGERGPELWVPDSSGTVIPAHTTAALLSGSGAAPIATGAGSAGQKSNISVYPFTDPKQMADHLEKNDDHEKWVVDVMSRNIHRFR